jgi:hypothetical protein
VAVEEVGECFLRLFHLLLQTLLDDVACAIPMRKDISRLYKVMVYGQEVRFIQKVQSIVVLDILSAFCAQIISYLRPVAESVPS